MSIKIKVCGMREPGNIKALLALKPDYTGFIFYKKSKRFVGDQLPDLSYTGTRKTGVFVDEDLSVLLQTAIQNKLDTVQLHGQEPPEYCQAVQAAGFEVIKAFAVDSDFDFNICKIYEPVTDLFLFDTKGLLPGGNGTSFDWNILSGYTLDKAFLLSGGISLQYLPALKTFSHPQLYGVDVNSGFEQQPAYKDINQLKTFFNELRGR